MMKSIEFPSWAPLTTIDPSREKYTVKDVEDYSVLQDAGFVREAHRGIEHMRRENAGLEPGSLLHMLGAEELSDAQEMLESAMEGYRFSLAMRGRAMAGACIAR